MDQNNQSLRKHPHDRIFFETIEKIVNENNETILYTLEIKKGEECPICKKTID